MFSKTYELLLIIIRLEINNNIIIIALFILF